MENELFLPLSLHVIVHSTFLMVFSAVHSSQLRHCGGHVVSRMHRRGVPHRLSGVPGDVFVQPALQDNDVLKVYSFNILTLSFPFLFSPSLLLSFSFLLLFFSFSSLFSLFSFLLLFFSFSSPFLLSFLSSLFSLFSFLFILSFSHSSPPASSPRPPWCVRVRGVRSTSRRVTAGIVSPHRPSTRHARGGRSRRTESASR